MLRTRNKYCSNCLSTQRFLDLGSSLVCERCSKRLECLTSIESARERVTTRDAQRDEVRLVAWMDPSERREAV